MIIVGSHLCPSTLYAIFKCKDAGITFRFQDLSASLADLRGFLALHEHDKVYAAFRESSKEKDYHETGKIGLPCFLFEDGYKTLNLDEAIERAKK